MLNCGEVSSINCPLMQQIVIIQQNYTYFLLTGSVHSLSCLVKNIDSAGCGQVTFLRAETTNCYNWGRRLYALNPDSRTLNSDCSSLQSLCHFTKSIRSFQKKVFTSNFNLHFSLYQFQTQIFCYRVFDLCILPSSFQRFLCDFG